MWWSWLATVPSTHPASVTWRGSSQPTPKWSVCRNRTWYFGLGPALPPGGSCVCTHCGTPGVCDPRVVQWAQQTTSRCAVFMPYSINCKRTRRTKGMGEGGGGEGGGGKGDGECVCFVSQYSNIAMLSSYWRVLHSSVSPQSSGLRRSQRKKFSSSI